MSHMEITDNRYANLEELVLLWEATDKLLLLVQLHELGPPGISGLRNDLKEYLDPMLKEYNEINTPKKTKPRSFWSKFGF